jgi:probable phosphoglycerate mutase
MIYLVRHGETAFNAEGRLQGRLDSPLTDLGRAQARAVGEWFLDRLGDRADDVVIESSPQGRALDTASIIALAMGAGRPARTDARLREIALGAWEGLTPAQIIARWPGAWRSTVRQSWAEHCPDGETYEAAEARLQDWLDSVPAGESRIVVSHGVSIGLLRGLYLGLSRDETLGLLVPQGVVFALDGGEVRSFATSGALTSPGG